MDLSYLLHRQQVERRRAHFASCDEARRAHAQLATLYEEAIKRLTTGRIPFLNQPEQQTGDWTDELRQLVRVREGTVSVLSDGRPADAPLAQDPAPS